MTLEELKKYGEDLVRSGWSWEEAYRMVFKKIEKLVEKRLDKDFKK